MGQTDFKNYIKKRNYIRPTDFKKPFCFLENTEIFKQGGS